jgi:AFG3 family protein
MDKEREKKIAPKVPRPNYQMWIILVLVAVVLGISYINKSGELVEITESRFEDMVEARNIKKLVQIKSDNIWIIEITLKEDALQNAKYKQEIERSSPWGVKPNGPHYKMKVGSIDKFIEKYELLQKNVSRADQIDLKVEERQDYTSFLFNMGFLVLLVLGFWMLMRRMTGGGGPGGQIFNIGKSKAALFDAENKVRITFADVAGLEEAKEEVKEIVDFLKTPQKFTKLGW